MKARAGWIAGFCSILAFVGAANGGSIPIPAEYGKVIIRNFSEQAGIAPVRFDHWLHRAFYTCRLCHVDIGFAMEANATKINAEMNIKGFYCGSCHNGIRVHGDRKIFASCSLYRTTEEAIGCSRCHSVGKNVKKEYDYTSFTGKLPKENLGNLIDWQEAESKELIRPVDVLPGISVSRAPLNVQKDFRIKSKGWMPNITFSHKKHALWNGCELCHPEIFPSVKKDTVKYSMLQIVDEQYCGLCHGSVAFPLYECQKCHTNMMPR